MMPPPVWPQKWRPEPAPELQAWPGPSNGGPALSAYRPCGTRAPTRQEAIGGGKKRHSPCRQNVYCPVGHTIHACIKIQRMTRVKRQTKSVRQNVSPGVAQLAQVNVTDTSSKTRKAGGTRFSEPIKAAVLICGHFRLMASMHHHHHHSPRQRHLPGCNHITTSSHPR